MAIHLRNSILSHWTAVQTAPSETTGKSMKNLIFTVWGRPSITWRQGRKCEITVTRSTTRTWQGGPVRPLPRLLQKQWRRIPTAGSRALSRCSRHFRTWGKRTQDIRRFFADRPVCGSRWPCVWPGLSCWEDIGIHTIRVERTQELQ